MSALALVGLLAVAAPWQDAEDPLVQLQLRGALALVGGDDALLPALGAAGGDFDLSVVGERFAALRLGVGPWLRLEYRRTYRGLEIFDEGAQRDLSTTPRVALGRSSDELLLGARLPIRDWYTALTLYGGVGIARFRDPTGVGPNARCLRGGLEVSFELTRQSGHMSGNLALFLFVDAVRDFVRPGPGAPDASGGVTTVSGGIGLGFGVGYEPEPLPPRDYTPLLPEAPSLPAPPETPQDRLDAPRRPA